MNRTTEETTMRAIEEIEKKQKDLQKGSAPWCVGEQLKDMLRARGEHAAALVLTDLQGPGMGLEDAEKKIAAFAKQNKTAGVGFCGPQDAERILCEFYGLERTAPEPQPELERPARRKISLADFL